MIQRWNLRFNHFQSCGVKHGYIFVRCRRFQLNFIQKQSPALDRFNRFRDVVLVTIRRFNVPFGLSEIYSIYNGSCSFRFDSGVLFFRRIIKLKDRRDIVFALIALSRDVT